MWNAGSIGVIKPQTTNGPPMHSFTPSRENTRALRDALGHYATGVCVVTCAGPDGPVGMTVNSFASLSLDPPLILWSPGKSSRRGAAFTAAHHFAVHVLAQDSAHLAQHFAKAGGDFTTLSWTPSAHGPPLLPNALARFECRTHAQHDAGDHVLLIGLVEQAYMQPGEPLVFYGGGYRALSP
jgi:flavin reductase (DIM6/NTAB) family NADH-FMN oxidoreductase RutF